MRRLDQCSGEKSLATGKETEQKRQHFRLEFPPDERPLLHLKDGNLEVLDVSEGGCSVQCDTVSFIKLSRPGTRIAGTIKFVTGEKVEVEGTVLRTIADMKLALKFSKGVPLPVMMSEHRRILKKYAR